MVHTPHRREKLKNTGPSHTLTELYKIKVKNVCLIEYKQNKTFFFPFKI